MSKIGFIGTGTMGKPMAQKLQSAGHVLYFSEHRSPAPQSLLGSNGIACPDLKAVAETCEFIILMVPDTPQVEEVLLSRNGIVEGIGAGKLVIDMSSISPIATKMFARKVEARGARYLDAPVSGGEVGARAGTLSIMAGGEQDSFDRALPLFQCMGANITLVGGNGDGQTCKVANQIIVALTIEAVSEALVFASKAGADPARIRAALMGGFAASRILEVHGERMLHGTFDPGFRIALHQKDLKLALSGAREMGMSLPNTAATQQMLNSCVAQGDADQDHSALIKAIERAANHSIRNQDTSA